MITLRIKPDDGTLTYAELQRRIAGELHRPDVVEVDRRNWLAIVTEKDGLCRYGIWRWPDTCDLDGVQIMRVR